MMPKTTRYIVEAEKADSWEPPYHSLHRLSLQGQGSGETSQLNASYSPVSGPAASLHVTQSSTLRVLNLSIWRRDGKLIIPSGQPEPVLGKSNCQKLPFVLYCNQPIRLFL